MQLLGATAEVPAHGIAILQESSTCMTISAWPDKVRSTAEQDHLARHLRCVGFSIACRGIDVVMIAVQVAMRTLTDDQPSMPSAGTPTGFRQCHVLVY
jgi:hypothetical protein